MRTTCLNFLQFSVGQCFGSSGFWIHFACGYVACYTFCSQFGVVLGRRNENKVCFVVMCQQAHSHQSNKNPVLEVRICRHCSLAPIVRVVSQITCYIRSPYRDLFYLFVMLCGISSGFNSF